MVIAIAAMGPGAEAQVAAHAARAPYFLLFDTGGEGVEAVANPYIQADHGAGPAVAAWLEERGGKALAGGFGPRLRAEFAGRGMTCQVALGRCADLMAERVVR